MTYQWNQAVAEQTRPYVVAFEVCCERNNMGTAEYCLEKINEILDGSDAIQPFDERVLDAND